MVATVCRVVLIVLISGVCLFSAGQAIISTHPPEILQPPHNITIFSHQTAMFTCEVTGGHTSWAVNGKAFTELSSKLRNDLGTSLTTSEEGNPQEILTIPARVEYNGTTVQCLVNAGFSDQSGNVSLIIQGALSAVSDLRVNSNASSVTISWTAPFSLDVTGVDPDIWYSVFIYNVTDENNPTAILCTDCINITETHYTFTPDYLSPCHVYNFSVIPVNGAGQGAASNKTSLLHTLVVSSLLEANITVLEQSPDIYQILITAPLVTTNKTMLCFRERLKLYYESGKQEQCPSKVSVVFPELTVDGVWRILSLVILGKDCSYTVDLVTNNGTREITSNGKFSISTRAIGVEVEEHTGQKEILVRCVFRHTLSERCYVQLVSSEVEGGFLQGGCVEGEGEGDHRFSGLLPASYTVLVYGLAAAEREEDSCSPTAGDPDYISVATVSGPQSTSVVKTTWSQDLPTSSNPLCPKGVGVGVVVGTVATCLLFVMGIIAVKVLIKHKEKKKGTGKRSSAPPQHVAMERNMAYELHKPQPRRKDHSEPKQCSVEASNAIYEDLK